MPKKHSKKGFNYRDYLLLPTDVVGLIRAQRAGDWWRILSVAVFAATLDIFTSTGLEGMFFLCFFLALFLWDSDGRIAIKFALGCLALIVILEVLIRSNVLLADESWTEAVAVWAYYFLCMGVIKQVVDLARERFKDTGVKNPEVIKLKVVMSSWSETKRVKERMKVKSRKGIKEDRRKRVGGRDKKEKGAEKY